MSEENIITNNFHWSLDEYEKSTEEMAQKQKEIQQIKEHIHYPKSSKSFRRKGFCSSKKVL